MIGKIIGAIAGKKVGDHVRGMSGTTGAVLGAAAPFVLRRLSLPAMLALAAGGYAYKRYQDQQTKRPVRRTRKAAA
jgi:hypothetical protein